MKCTAFVRAPLGRFEQQVAALSKNSAGVRLSPTQFREALSGLREELNQWGRESLGALVARAEESGDALERERTGALDQRCGKVDRLTAWAAVQRALAKALAAGRRAPPANK